MRLEAYKPGVTDANGSIWQEIDADARTYQNATGNIIGATRPNVVGRRGNNAVYQIALQPLSPSAVTGLDPASKDATLEVAFDGKTMVSIPVQFSCEN